LPNGEANIFLDRVFNS